MVDQVLDQEQTDDDAEEFAQYVEHVESECYNRLSSAICAKTDSDDIEFVDTEERSAEHVEFLRERFELDDLKERLASHEEFLRGRIEAISELRVGDYAKIGVETINGEYVGEHFWVSLIHAVRPERHEFDKYIGVITNVLICTNGELTRGDIVEFEANNIALVQV